MNTAVRYSCNLRTSRFTQGLSTSLFVKRFQQFHPSLHRQGSISATQRKTNMSSSKWASYPRKFPSSGFSLIEPSLEIEEETLPTYLPEKYYPVELGQVVGERYQVLAKLGYGVTSTVWLARDLIRLNYVVLKIYVVGQDRNHELHIYDRIKSVQTDHPGKRFIRKLFESFSIDGPSGQHICLVHEPLGISVNELMDWIPGHVMDLDSLKRCIRQLLVVLDFLHTECHLIHTDLQLKNLLLPAPDEEVLNGFEQRQIEKPPARKVLADRTIYRSSRFPLSDGLPLLSDFGEARFGDEEHTEDIMPNVYRAPEVVLKANWDYTVDIWNVALVAWDMFCTRTLFDGRNSDGIFDDRVHLAELVALLGPPPEEFRKRMELNSVFWDESGSWKGLAPLPDITLERSVENIDGEDKEGFLRWLCLALQWDPKDRPTAQELLLDEWMMKGLKLPKRENADGDA